MTVVQPNISEAIRRAPAAITLQADTFRLYLFYRFVLSLTLILAYTLEAGPPMFGSAAPELFGVAVYGFFGFAVLSLVGFYANLWRRNYACYFAITTDIVAITVIMHASGGVESGLGILLAISIALGSLSLVGRTALFFASLATLAIFAERLYTQMTSPWWEAPNYTQAGLLGAAFFALALLAHQLSARVRESEQLIQQRELDLANMAQLNEHVIQRMQTGIIVIDTEHRIRLMNDSAWHLLGMPAGARQRELEEISPRLAEQHRDWARNHDAERASFRAVAGGRDVRAAFMTLGSGGELGVLIFLEDAALVMERAQQIKLASLGQLTASIAHEIRNPLGAISHAAQLLDESPDLPQTDKRLTEIIQENSGRVNEVIENVLSLSRREPRHPEPVGLKGWLDKVADELLTLKALDPAQLSIYVEPERTEVFADPSQLRQILSILLDNAVEHFGADRSTLRLQLIAGISPETGVPFIDIIDNGPGIKGDGANKIFEPFFTTRTKGTGLGLYIARELSEANRLRLEYLPVPSGGSCFRLSFPIPPKSVQSNEAVENQ